MNVEMTELPESRVTLKIELTPQEVEEALHRTYKQLVQRVNIPGFRKGKAPRPMVERAVGQEMFLHEATDEAVRWGYRKAVDQENLTPIDEADVKPGEEHEHIEPGDAFIFEATVTVKPQVQLPDYSAITVERTQPEVVDEDIDNLLHDIQERNATLEPVARPAQLDDVVTINITGKVDGEEVLSQENTDFHLIDEDSEGPSARLPGLATRLAGVTPGDIKEIPLPLPDTYPDQELAGKTIFLRVLTKEVKRRVLPELNDEFAESVSQFTTLDELRKVLRSNLLAERTFEAEEKLVNDAVEAVVSRSFVEIPPILISEEQDRLMQEMERAFSTRGVSLEMYLQVTQKTPDDMRQDTYEDAVKNVKTSLVLGAVADAESIEISGREVDVALEEVLNNTHVTGAERRRLRASTGVRSNIRSRLRRQRAIQKLVGIVTDGEEVSSEATEAMADQTSVAEDTEETVAVEIGS